MKIEEEGEEEKERGVTFAMKAWTGMAELTMTVNVPLENMLLKVMNMHALYML